MYIIDKKTKAFKDFDEQKTLTVALLENMCKKTNAQVAERKANKLALEYKIIDSSYCVIVVDVGDRITVVNFSSTNYSITENYFKDNLIPLLTSDKVLDTLDAEVRAFYAKCMKVTSNFEKVKSFTVDENGNIAKVENEIDYGYLIGYHILSYYLSANEVKRFEEEFKQIFIPDHLFEVIDTRTNEKFFFTKELKFAQFKVEERDVYTLLKESFEYIPEYLNEAVHFIKQFLEGKEDITEIKKRIMANND